jgi:hypothetical protein
MKVLLSVCAAVGLFCTLSIAGSTKFVSTYRNPKAGLNDLSGKKIGCFVVIPSEELRSAREETVAAELRLRGINSFAGYTILPGELLKDREKALQFLNKSGISGAVMVRLIDDQEAKKYSTTTTTAWTSQPYYGSFSGYWNQSWSTVHETTWTERVVTLEVLIYSIERNELIWAGRSNTTSPKDIKRFVKDLMDAAGKKLRKEGLVSK